MAISIAVRIWLACLPPPIASKAMVAPVSTSACVRSSVKLAAVESTTCLAPMPFRIFACSALRTMFTRPMPSSVQILFSIWPRLEAAAVWTTALWPSRFMVSVMPSAVSGLTNHDAPSVALVPAGSGWQSRAFKSRYCAYIAPPTIDTVLPISACAASDEPALITVPAPSLPTGIAWSSRAARKGRAACETLALTRVLSPLPDVVAAAMSAGPSSRPRSDGLIGVASTFTTTWSGPGSGTSTLASDSSSSPLFLIRERSCRPVVIVSLLGSSPPGDPRGRDGEQQTVDQDSGRDAAINARRAPAQDVERQQPAARGDGEAGGGGGARPDHVARAHGREVERHREAEEAVGRADDAEVETPGLERRRIAGEQVEPEVGEDRHDQADGAGDGAGHQRAGPCDMAGAGELARALVGAHHGDQRRADAKGQRAQEIFQAAADAVARDGGIAGAADQAGHHQHGGVHQQHDDARGGADLQDVG